jgi:muconolactone delta-isomerase
MQSIVAIRFDQGQREAITVLLPAEQAHVRDLMEQGVITAIHIAADRSRVWVVMRGESQEDIQWRLTAFPLYPYMQTELTPLLETAPVR